MRLPVTSATAVLLRVQLVALTVLVVVLVVLLLLAVTGT
jgi:hypothetical protein